MALPFTHSNPVTSLSLVFPKHSKGWKEEGVGSRPLTHTQTFPALCREGLADREMSGWGRKGVRGQLTVSARGSLPAPSSLGVHPFWIMGIASVGSTPAFSLSSRDFLDSEEEWEGAMRSHPTLPLS